MTDPTSRPANPGARPEDAHVIMGELIDPGAACESLAIDAVADRQWLQDHPQATERRRLASPREIRACGCPPGTIVVVRRGPLESQIRMLGAPPSNLN